MLSAWVLGGGAVCMAGEARAMGKAQAAGDSISRIDIYATAGGYTDKARVIFREDAAPGYEAGYDAAKFITATAPIQIYILDIDNIACSQVMLPASNEPIRLGYSLLTAGSIELSTPVYAAGYALYDAQTGEYYPLGEDVTLPSAAGTHNSRLELRIAPEVPTDNATATTLPATSKQVKDGIVTIRVQEQGKEVCYQVTGAVAVGR